MTRRVIVYPLHEYELAAALQAMRMESQTPSTLVGEVDDVQLEALRAQGILVEELTPLEPPRATTWPSILPGAWDTFGFGVRRSVPAGLRGERAVYPGYFMMRIVPPLLAPYRADVEATGATLVDRVADDAYSVRLTSASQREALRKLVFVRGVRPYDARDTGPRMAARSAEAAPAEPAPDRSTFDVILHDAAALDPVLAFCRVRGLTVERALGRKLRVRAKAELIAALSARTEVALVEQHLRPVLFNDHARALVGATPTLLGANALGLTGDGVIVGISDSGLDDTHDDFKGRVVASFARGRPGDSRDYQGHGTHVAGTVLGDGAASQGLLAGMAPKAKLVVHAVVDAAGELRGVIDDLPGVLAESYAAGARIHNASWGTDSGARYGTLSYEIDEFVATHRDMLVVVAAGNAGTALDPVRDLRHAQPGWVDWYSVGAPGTSKNALVVGASRSDRTAGGRSRLTWADVWPERFADPPTASETISGDADRIAAFSSRGLTSDGRVKPDIVAPGTDIASARSRDAPLTAFWASVGRRPRYAYLGGTSMATPVVSGAAALVRQYFVSQRAHAPSAALLKATLINGARWLSGPDAVADHSARPNPHQGFGLLDLATTLPHGPTLLAFDDGWQDPTRSLPSVGAARDFLFTTTAPGPLRVTLAFTDVPMPRLQNNLDLLVERLPATGVPGAKWTGNAGAPQKPRLYDGNNNVETVHLASADAAAWRVRIYADELTRPPQDFALVVLGLLASPDLVPGP